MMHLALLALLHPVRATALFTATVCGLAAVAIWAGVTDRDTP